jgi:hypothetical protein
VTEDIRANLEESQATVLVLLDFRQVFDRVVHELVLCKMKNSYQHSDEDNKLLSSYLDDRQQLVRSGDVDCSTQLVTFIHYIF